MSIRKKNRQKDNYTSRQKENQTDIRKHTHPHMHIVYQNLKLKTAIETESHQYSLYENK